MLSRRIPAVLAGMLVGSLLAVPPKSSPAHAGSRVQIDNDDFDVQHRDIDIDKLKVDEGSPSLTTGDWFDTTYDLVVFR